MAYATVEDVQARMTRDLTTDEQAVCSTYLDDVAVMIDGYNREATDDAKKIVSCRIVIRAIGDGDLTGIPAGATQGSQAGLGYSQSWTITSGGSVGELYLSKADKQLLGYGSKIGSYSPVEELVIKEISS